MRVIADYHNAEETIALQLWSSGTSRGTLYRTERATPADAWGPPELVGRGYSVTSVARMARREGLLDRNAGKRPEPFIDDDGVELVTERGELTLAGAERLLGEERGSHAAA